MAAERFLSLRIADLPMVLLLAVRTTEVGPLAVPLAEILADPATVSIRPGPLSPEGAASAWQALLGSADPDFAAACHHATGGNPFLLEQLVSEVRAEGIEPTGCERRRGWRRSGPDTVRASVLLRLERLPSAGGPVARALAVLGEHDISVRDVATLAGVPEDDSRRGPRCARALRARGRAPRTSALHAPDPARGDRGRHARGGALARARAGGAHARRPRRRPGGRGRAPAGVRAGPGRVGDRQRCARPPAAPRRSATPPARCAIWSAPWPSGPSRHSSPRCCSSWGSPPPTPAIPTPPSTSSAPRRRADRRACARCTGQPCCTWLRDA